MLDNRRLIVSLPKNHRLEIPNRHYPQPKTVSEKYLMSILGRLENIAQVLMVLGHFLSNIRHTEIIAADRGHNVRLRKRSKDYLQLAKTFFE